MNAGTHNGILFSRRAFSATNVQSVTLKEPQLSSHLLSWEAPWLGIFKPANGAPPDGEWSSAWEEVDVRFMSSWTVEILRHSKVVITVL